MDKTKRLEKIFQEMDLSCKGCPFCEKAIIFSGDYEDVQEYLCLWCSHCDIRMKVFANFKHPSIEHRLVLNFDNDENLKVKIIELVDRWNTRSLENNLIEE